jgi:hypothetical protein
MMARRRPGENAVRAVDEPLRAFPEVAPFAIAASDVTCRQGAYAYVARCLAQREGRILFEDPRTGQLGIARLQGEEGVEAMQFPFASVAVIMFLGNFEALEAE